MKNEWIDLHVHTTASDGTVPPREIVKLAADMGLKAIAITDHDTTLGCAEAMAAAPAGLEVIPGIEISTRYHTAVHILGYYIDSSNAQMRQALDWVLNDRDRRNRLICDTMHADGLPVNYEQLKQRFGQVIGRPHFARLCVEFGLAQDVQDAFRRFVGKDCRYYSPRNFLTIEQSISLIRGAGGIPVLAHPFQYRLDDAALRELIEHCIDSGLRGMECFYSGYTEEQSRYLLSLAGEYHLLVTGGSDFHGENKSWIQLGTGTGSLQVPVALLAALREAHEAGI